MDKQQLTKKQLAVFIFIVRHKKKHLIWPTWGEIAERFDWSTPSTYADYRNAFLRKGYLTHKHGEHQLTNKGEQFFKRWIKTHNDRKNIEQAEGV